MDGILEPFTDGRTTHFNAEKTEGACRSHDVGSSQPLARCREGQNFLAREVSPGLGCAPSLPRLSAQECVTEIARGPSDGSSTRSFETNC